MNFTNEKIEIDFLDHVALRVKDVHASAEWYQNVFGLKKYSPNEWGVFPIFLLAGKTGIALFPLNIKEGLDDCASTRSFIDHFAFNVTKHNFEKAKKIYVHMNMEYEFQDHHFFHSLYVKDPDGITVEITTIVIDDFYKKTSI